MSQYLPTGGFIWINPEAWDAEKIKALGNEDPISYFFEVDLEYPQHLHDAHDQYPFGIYDFFS